MVPEEETGKRDGNESPDWWKDQFSPRISLVYMMRLGKVILLE